MNIVITLPKEFIDKITSGRKSVEIRHSVPQHFNIDKDVVLVVEKGTRNIPILFSIKQFIIYDEHTFSSNICVEDVAVQQEWLNDYCLKAKRVCQWVIGRVCRLKYPTNAASSIGIKNNPQSFIYTNYDVAQFQLKNSFWGRRVHDNEKSRVYAPDKRNMVIQEYLASDCEVDFLQWCEDYKIPYNWRGWQLK